MKFGIRTRNTKHELDLGTFGFTVAAGIAGFAKSHCTRAPTQLARSIRSTCAPQGAGLIYAKDRSGLLYPCPAGVPIDASSQICTLTSARQSNDRLQPDDRFHVLRQSNEPAGATTTPPTQIVEAYHAITQAIKALQDRGGKPNIAAAAKGFFVPEQRILRRWNGQRSKQQSPRKRKLRGHQESVSYQHLDRLGAIGLFKITDCANAILQRSHDGGRARQVSEYWARLFLEHPEYLAHKQTSNDLIKRMHKIPMLSSSGFRNTKYSRLSMEHHPRYI